MGTTRRWNSCSKTLDEVLLTGMAQDVVLEDPRYVHRMELVVLLQGPFHDELDVFALDQVLVAILENSRGTPRANADRRKVDENVLVLVFSIQHMDEPKTLFLVEPLYIADRARRRDVVC